MTHSKTRASGFRVDWVRRSILGFGFSFESQIKNTSPEFTSFPLSCCLHSKSFEPRWLHFAQCFVEPPFNEGNRDFGRRAVPAIKLLEALGFSE